MKLSNKYQKFIFSDPVGKAISIILAYFLWYYVQNFSIEKLYISLPVTIINIPQNKIIEATNDIAIRVEISAYEDVSRRIENLKAVIDLSNYTTGTKSYPITLLNLPKDIEANISPEFKRISIYDIINKTVPITINIKSNNALTNISYKPKEVTISGSSKIIEQIKALTTEELKINNSIQNVISTNLKIYYPNKVKLLDATSVDIILNFNRTNYTNEVIIPIKYIGQQSNLQISFTTNMYLKFVTTSSNIEPLLLESFMTLDLSNITNSGKHNIPINISVPTNVHLIEPPTVVPIELFDPSTTVALPMKEELTPANTYSNEFETFNDSIFKESKEITNYNFNTNITKETNLENNSM